MWPWEHAVFAYVCYSLVCRVIYRDIPGEYETGIVVVASILPDLIDKPLAWQFEVFQSGYAVAHSVFVASFLAVTGGLVAREYGQPQLGIAFGIGYLLHLVGDVVPLYISSGEWTIRHLLWPVADTDGRLHDTFFAGVRHNLEPYIQSLLALEFTPSLAGRFILGTVALILWYADHRPGLALIRTVPRRLYDRILEHIPAQ